MGIPHLYLLLSDQWNRRPSTEDRLGRQDGDFPDLAGIVDPEAQSELEKVQCTAPRLPLSRGRGRHVDVFGLQLLQRGLIRAVQIEETLYALFGNRSLSRLRANGRRAEEYET